MKTNIKEVNEHINNLNNEVTRLREQLTRVIEIAEKFRFYTKSYEWLSMKDELDKIKTEHEARLASPPEEPVNPICSNTTHKFSHCDCTEPAPDKNTELNTELNTEQPVSNSEWRDLLPDEVIAAWDQVQRDPDKGWHEVSGAMLGTKPSLVCWENYRFRTRRPLPKQEEMPLEDEIETIREYSEHIDSLTGHMAFKALAKSIRYIRDEIQRIDRALNVGEEDSGYNFVEIEKLKKEIQKLKAK